MTLPLARLQPIVRVVLSAPVPGPAETVHVTVIVEAVGAPLALRGVIAGAAPGEQSLLDLRLTWTDYPGDRPVSTGQATAVQLPFGAGGTAEPGRPLVVERDVPLASAAGLLARRVDVVSRLVGVDVVGAESHTGGTILPLPPATLQTFAPPPAGTLEQHLQSGSAAGIFLLAAAAPDSRREHVLGLLIDALPALGGAAREADFAALLYLTGETNGHDMHLWRSWWKERQASGAGR